MARKVCACCHRPEKVCICDLVEPIQNHIELAIWQHPSEVKQVKGSAMLTHLCLQNSQLWVGETLAETSELQAWLADDIPIYLLYPPTEESQADSLLSSHQLAQLVAESKSSATDTKPFKVLVLDGTWRKTFKMMQLNPLLQTLPRITIELEQASNYVIRKQKNSQSLSTLEAIAQLMSDLENNPIKFQPLHKAFAKMQQHQLQFIQPTDK